MNKNIVLTLILTLSLAPSATAQARATGAAKKPVVATAPTTPVTTPVPTPAPPAPPEKLVPAVIVYGGGSIPGDSAVNADIDKANDLRRQYEDGVKALESRLQPQWEALNTQLTKDIDLVKKANNWNENVIYQPETRTWIRMTPEQVAAAKAAAAKAAAATTK